MRLKEIYYPIKRELKEVESTIETSLSETKHDSILKVNRFLLEAPGKRLRPALVILSAKAASGHKSTRAQEHKGTREKPQSTSHQLINIAAAIELIHTASLIHDDVIDHASLRHNRPSVNSKWGQDMSIAFGDYLYSKAFELIATCGNTDVLKCISQAASLMCEGELLQVCERENISLLKERYLLIIKNKTAGLFAASCQAGAMLSNSPKDIHGALKDYGLNIGIAFQITDDCMDLFGKKEDLGKTPGADFKMGELTLPVLNLLSQIKDKRRLLALVKQSDKQGAFKEIKQAAMNSEALVKTKEEVGGYIRKAKNGLNKLDDSDFKDSLFSLADDIVERVADINAHS